MTTTTNGSEARHGARGQLRKVMPLDVPTQLLRALIVGDTNGAVPWGMELEEEDLALCSYVCPGKYEYGPILRDNLTRIERRGLRRGLRKFWTTWSTISRKAALQRWYAPTRCFDTFLYARLVTQIHRPCARTVWT